MTCFLPAALAGSLQDFLATNSGFFSLNGLVRGAVGLSSAHFANEDNPKQMMSRGVVLRTVPEPTGTFTLC